MAKRKTSIVQDLENPLTEDSSGYGKGIFVGLIVLSLIGFAVWFLLDNHESH